jgi:DNA-binding response OmpR family regulator
MLERRLRGCSILVVEDEYLLADELTTELRALEARVLGPVGTIDAAFALVRSGQPIDAAVIDVNLGGEMAFPLADLLIERSIPFLFTTGYDESVIPNRFAGVVRLEKPLNTGEIAEAVARIFLD